MEVWIGTREEWIGLMCRRAVRVRWKDWGGAD